MLPRKSGQIKEEVCGIKRDRFAITWLFSLDTTTKVLFGDSALQICGTAQSQNGASYLSCHFGDDATFSISSKAGQLSIQFCDVNGRVYSFAKDGSVTSQSFAKSPVTTSIKSREIKRVYLPSVS